MTIEEDTLRHVMSRIGELGERVTALESARVTPTEARESEPVCECRHQSYAHANNTGFCCAPTGSDIEGNAGRCDCQSYRPAAPPAPEPVVVTMRNGEQITARVRDATPDEVSASDPAPTVALDPGDVKTLLRMVEGLKATEAEMLSFKRLAGRVWS